MEYYLGKTIKQLRQGKNWSQKDLAKRINKSVSTISGYESDAHAVPLDVLATIAQLYGGCRESRKFVSKGNDRTAD